MSKLFGINGLGGLLIAVVLILSLVAILGYKGVLVQQAESMNFYQLDKNAIEMNSSQNAQHYKLIKE